MDANETKPEKQYSIWQVLAALIVFFGLSLLISQRSPTVTGKKTAFASVADSEQKQSGTSTSTSPADINSRAAAPLAPSSKRALERIRSFTEVQALLKDPKNKLIEAEKVEGLGVWTMKYQHFYNGVEVLGSMATYHNGPGGEQVRSHLKDVKVETDPKISAHDAEQTALQKVGKDSRATNQPQLKILPSRDSREAKLIYSIQVRDSNTVPHEVWIDAHSGELVSDMSRLGEFSRSGGTQ